MLLRYLTREIISENPYYVYLLKKSYELLVLGNNSDRKKKNLKGFFKLSWGG